MTSERTSEAPFVPANSSFLSRAGSASLAQRGTQDIVALERAEECYREGLIFISQNDRVAAVRPFMRGLESDPLHIGIRDLLGVIYSDSRLKILDYEVAFQHFSIAAAQGSDKAAGALGVMYLNGQGVTRDSRKAFFWMDKAAQHGSATCQWWLGQMYEDGCGVERDPQKAVFWYQLAAAQCDVEPSEIVTDLQKVALGMMEDDRSDTEEPLEDQDVHVIVGSGELSQQGPTKMIRVWQPYRDGSCVPALGVRYNGTKMTRETYQMLIQSRLSELIAADPGTAKWLLTGSAEYSPDLYTIATYNQPQHWPVQIMMCGQVHMMLNEIDWDKGGVVNIDPDELPSLAEIIEHL